MTLRLPNCVKLDRLTRSRKSALWGAVPRSAAPSSRRLTIGPQTTFLGPSGGPQTRPAPTGTRRGAVAAAFLAAALALPGAAPGQTPSSEARADSAGIAEAPGAPPSPSAAALVARGIGHYEQRAMREGVRELERAVALRPGWTTAQMALSTALLRGGSFDRALAGFEELLGVDTARGLASGALEAGDLAVPADADAVLGLAVAKHQLGKLREADRLYRCAADLWGPSSRESARAYYLLSEMLGETRVPWGDPDGERAKALALDPSVADSDVLPAFVDPTVDPELEPYTWSVAIARRDSLLPVPDSPPALAEWRTQEIGAASEFQGTVTVEALVTRNGSVAEATVTGPAGIAQDLADAAVQAVGAARFEPAVVSGVAAEAWIVISIPARAL
jgi:TonB family protein